MIKTVWIDNPPMNTIGGAVIEHLWDELERLEDARVVVLRGVGDRAFSAGADIGGFGSFDEGESTRPRGVQPLADLLESLDVPAVAAIHGYCLGGGLELALGCDFRVAQADSQLGFPEVNLGLLPGGGGTQRTPRLTGPSRAAWLVMSGQRIPAKQAEGWGLVDFVVDDLEAGIEQVAGALAKQSPHALRVIKRLLRETRYERDDKKEFAGFLECLSSEDGQEGVAAFFEKREPGWTGR